MAGDAPTRRSEHRRGVRGARGLSPADSDFEAEHEEAEMERGWAPYADVYDAVIEGRLTDGPLVQLVLLARARGLVGTREG